MDRRETLKAFTGGAAGVLTLGASRAAIAQVAATAPQPAANGRERARAGGVPALKITDIKVIALTVDGHEWVNTKVYTSEPGLYGLGCGSHVSVRVAPFIDTIEQYFKPFLIGRDPSEIEQIWQELFVSEYWRSGPDANCAMAAIDGALWDIMGKRCGVPVYDLLGGRTRNGLRVIGNGNGGRDLKEMEDRVRAQMADGYDHFRVASPGLVNPPKPKIYGAGNPITVVGSDAEYTKGVVETFDYVRKNIGWDIEIGTDVHERPTPRGAVILAKAVEQYRPFFMEDLFAPEDVGWFKTVREESAIGIAMGEIIVNQQEWMPLVTNRWIDFIRLHIATAGGMNMARKVAHVCEFFGVQTAWHGPTDISPVGHAVNCHLDLSIYNFGICEAQELPEKVKELYPGGPQTVKGIRDVNDKPGFGVDIDEKVALKYKSDGGVGVAHAVRQDDAPWRP